MPRSLWVLTYLILIINWGLKRLHNPSKIQVHLTPNTVKHQHATFDLKFWSVLFYWLDLVHFQVQSLPVILQVLLSVSNVYSSSHQHRKEPLVLKQCWLQKPGTSHSSMSSQVLESLARRYPDGHRHWAPKGPWMHWWVQPPLESEQLSWSRIKRITKEKSQESLLFWFSLL